MCFWLAGLAETMRVFVHFRLFSLDCIISGECTQHRKPNSSNNNNNALCVVGAKLFIYVLRKRNTNKGNEMEREKTSKNYEDLSS